MSNAPKAGFFQTIPGLITATAGFLSAATGAIVALNQTGVVDLKKVVGTKPPEQAAPLVPATVASPVEQGPRGSELYPAGAAAEAKKTEPAAPPASVATTQPAETAAPRETEVKPSQTASAPSSAVIPSTQPVAEAKPQPSLPTSTTDAEKLNAIREGAAATVPKKVEQTPVTSAPTTPTRENPPPNPAQERVAESRPEPAKPLPSPATRETEKPLPPSSRPVETVPTVVKAPPSPSAADKTPPTARPEPGGRTADARHPDRSPDRPATAGDDPARAKIVRPPTDAVATRSGSKRLATDDDAGVRRGADGAREIRSAGPAGNRPLDLAGLKMTLPAGWVNEEVKPGPLAPVAALRIPDPSGDGMVQITRFLGAKGKEMEDRTIERWVGQVTKANGAPMTLADAKIERRQSGPMKITTVDLSGTVKMTPRDSGEPGSRMISAIIDHPAGPHLVTIVGPARSMAKWDSAIDDFLKSAKPE